MSFLLKIVEGPNKGAEIALVQGLCVTIGKADSCDIILADPTLPDTPLQIEAAADGVSLETPDDGRSHLEPYHVVTVGSTSFAVGSAESAWPTLVWPKKEEPKKEDEPAEPAPEKPEEKPAEPAKDEKKDDGKKKSRVGWLVAAIVVVLVLLILGALGWIFRDRISAMLSHGGENVEMVEGPQISPIDALIEKYALESEVVDGRTVLKGNFKTRSERLAATAEAYATQPGIELDFADEESLKSAVEDTLALVGEKQLRVERVEKRVATLSGKANNLRAALEAISGDVPKIKNVDCAAVTTSVAQEIGEDGLPIVAHKRAKPKVQTIDFPVCGIITNPYPCLVMRNGMRILEGASIGENVIVKIETDQVIITNSAGRVIWKP